MRNDTGVFEGGEISTFYDPMIAKLCTWAPTREAAIDAMAVALDEFEVEGVGNNLPFLSAVMEQQRFREGRLTTGYIAEEFPHGFSGVELDAQMRRRDRRLRLLRRLRLAARGFCRSPAAAMISRAARMGGADRRRALAFRRHRQKDTEFWLDHAGGRSDWSR